jgi:hypothetical protein
MTQFAKFVSDRWPDVSKPEAMETEFLQAYPGVDLLAEATKAWLWENAMPSRKKRNHRTFLMNWLNRCAAGGFSGPAQTHGNIDRMTPGQVIDAKRLAEARAKRAAEQTRARAAALDSIRRVPPREARIILKDILRTLGEKDE